MTFGSDTAVAERIQLITSRVAPADTDCEAGFEGYNLYIAKGVFNPARGKSTCKMLNALTLVPLEKGERVLEIGTGSGVLSIHAWKKTGAAPVAVDIMPEAVACATTNFNRYSVPAKPRLSDLFSAVQGKFDVVVFNAPTAHPSVAEDNPGLTTLWDKTGCIKSRFVYEMPGFLNDSPKARAYMMYSVYKDYDSLAPIDFSGFNVHKLFIDRDELSESGVILLTRASQLKPV